MNWYSVASRLLRGDDVEASEYYFRTAPVFQTDAPAHRWLTGGIVEINRDVRERKVILSDGHHSAARTNPHDQGSHPPPVSNSTRIVRAGPSPT